MKEKITCQYDGLRIVLYDKMSVLLIGKVCMFQFDMNSVWIFFFKMFLQLFRKIYGAMLPARAAEIDH